MTEAPRAAYRIYAYCLTVLELPVCVEAWATNTPGITLLRRAGFPDVAVDVHWNRMGPSTAVKKIEQEAHRLARRPVTTQELQQARANAREGERE